MTYSRIFGVTTVTYAIGNKVYKYLACAMKAWRKNGKKPIIKHCIDRDKAGAVCGCELEIFLNAWNV